MSVLDPHSRIRRRLRLVFEFVGDLVHRRVSERAARWSYSAVLILVYHRIARPSSDPHKIAVSPERFDEHLATLRRWGHPLRLRDLPGLLRNGNVPHRGYVVTLDDGYADNLLNAKPLLEKYDTPATVFAASAYAPGGREYWWDLLDRILTMASAKGLSLQLGGDAIDASPGGALHQRLGASAGVEVDAVLEELASQVGSGTSTEPEALPMTASQLCELSASGLVEIGSHTITHRRLAQLSEREQREEIFGARQSLEQVLGRSVETFAYPFGSEGSDYSEVSQRLVREAGHSCACAVRPASVGRRTDLYGLPRCWVSNWDGDEMARRLRFWYVK